MRNTQEHVLKQIYGALQEARQIPMWGMLPSFDWVKFSNTLSDDLGIGKIQVHAGTPEWMNSDKLLSDTKIRNAFELIKISPFNGQLLWLMSAEDRDKLCSHLLSPSSSRGFSDAHFQEGFYKYLLLEAINSFEKMGLYPDFHPRITEEDIYTESFCVIPVSISFQGISVFGKLALSAQLQEGLKGHYADKTPTLDSHPLASDLEVQLKLQVASTSLSLQAWKKVQIGDCILLDHCSYDPAAHKGSVSLLINDTPIFRAKFKKSSLKILDYAFYYEEEKVMTNEDLTPEEEPNLDDFAEEEPLSETEEEMQEGESHLWSEKPTPNGSTEKLISTQEIPLTLVVEVDRIRMNLDKLLQLSPGNILELSVRPEQGVHVTVGGKRVAKAELIKIGDALGIKILQLGETAD